MANSTFLKNSFLTFTRNIVVITLGLLTTVLIARILGPEKQGMYALIILLPNMLMTFMNLGISSSTVYYIGKRKYSLQTVISTNVVLSVAISLISIILGVAIIPLFSESFFDGIPVILLLSILSVLPILTFNNFIQSFFQGTEDFKTFNIIAVIGKLVNLISLILTIYLLPLGITGALFSFVLGNLTTTIIVIYYIIKQNYKIVMKDFSYSYLKDSLKYGFKSHLSNILAFLNYRVDMLLISFFLGPLPVGIYNVAINIAERLWIISKPVATVMFPRVSSSSEKEQNNLTAVVSRNVLFLSIIAGIVLYILSDIVIYLLFGEAYLDASLVIKILLPGITVFSCERILSNSLAGKGKPEMNLYTSIFTVICNITLNVILIPIYGLNGAAFSTSASYVLSFIIKIVIYAHFTKSKIPKLLLIDQNDLYLYRFVLKKVMKRK
ncbi:flippase [Caldalkalibacillus salinus]|uniref:flippase n=1 Tax=Caldalkalibacillus salinus TaxID=2803787 RepID=UPI001923129B|nr:flippase [Caldalkalibacillus salinus]